MSLTIILLFSFSRFFCCCLLFFFLIILDPDGGGADPEVRSEASWAVLNATSCGSDHQVLYNIRQPSRGRLSVIYFMLCTVMFVLTGNVLWIVPQVSVS